MFPFLTPQDQDSIGNNLHLSSAWQRCAKSNHLRSEDSGCACWTPAPKAKLSPDPVLTECAERASVLMCEVV